MKTYLTIALLLVAGAASAQQLSLADKMELRANCGSEFKALCPGVQPGGGQMMGCIKSKQDQLSKVCRDTIAKIKAKKPD